VGKIEANNQFYSKAYPTPRPPLAALSEGVSHAPGETYQEIYRFGAMRASARQVS